MFHGYVNVCQAGYVQKSKDTVAGHILNMGVSIHGGTPLLLDGLFPWKKTSIKWMMAGGTPISGNHHIPID